MANRNLVIVVLLDLIEFNYIKKRYWYSCGKIIDEKNANIYLGVILSHKDTFMFCKLMELQRMYFFYFSTLSSLPSI